MTTWSKVVVEWPFWDNGAETRIYTALFSQGRLLSFEMCLKSFIAQNGQRAVTEKMTKQTPYNVKKINNNNFDKMNPRWLMFSAVISWSSQRLCYPFVWVGHICDPTSRNESRGYLMRFWDFSSIVHSIDFSLKWCQKYQNRSTGF